MLMARPNICRSTLPQFAEYKQAVAVLYVLGLLDGMSGSVHKDTEHYCENAKLAAKVLREAFEVED